MLVLAPTGVALDVAMREGAGDEGMTIAKAVQSLRNDDLKLDRRTLVVVDEAGMVGTDDLRQLLTATTKIGAKTVLVGDAHQLAPVKARGGMFAQLCGDLPWTQQLEEVWRMTNPEERTASLALRDGDPKAIARAVDWSRTHDRLHCDDAITMAADALDAYTADVQLGRDALLICDTTEMADVLNQRIHHDRVDRDAATVTGARGQQVGVGDLIISRRDDPTIDFHHSTPNAESLPSVRNGNRWRVAAIDADTGLDQRLSRSVPAPGERESFLYCYQAAPTFRRSPLEGSLDAVPCLPRGEGAIESGELSDLDRGQIVG